MVVDANGGPCSGERAVNGVGDGGADGGAQGRGSQTPRVLIADDEDMVRIVAEAALTAAGFEVKTVNPTLLPRHGRFISRASQALEERRRSEERYALAVQGANDGLWDWDLTTGTVEIGTSIDEWLERVHPSQINYVRRELQAHLEGRTESFEVIAWVGSDRTERLPRT